MHTPTIIRVLIAVILLHTAFVLNAQDPHFTQFFLTHQLYNPAVTGTFDEDVRASAHYRQQWRSAGNGFTTSAINAEGNFLRRSGQYFSAGAFVLTDQSGNANIRSTQVLASGAFHLKVSNKNSMSAGMQFAMLQRSMDIAGLRWDAQYDGIQYDPTLPTMETMENSMIRRYDVATGVNWRHEGKYTYQVGYGVRHFGQDLSVMGGGPDRLPIRQVLMGRVDRNISFGRLRYELLVQRQRRFMEITMGGRCEYRFGQESRYTKNNTSSAVFAGCYYRFREAISPVVGFELKRFLSAYISYDIPISGVNKIVGIGGGPEFSVIWQGRFWERNTKLVK